MLGICLCLHDEIDPGLVGPYGDQTDMDSIKGHQYHPQLVVAERWRVADTFWTRLVGLLSRQGAVSGKGLMLVPCNLLVHGVVYVLRHRCLYVSEQRQVLHIRAPAP